SRIPGSLAGRRFASKGPTATFSVCIMRRWLIAAAVALVLLGGALAVAVQNLGRFLDTQRERLVRTVPSEIGRTVPFGDIRITLLGGLGVRVVDVRVPDDPSWRGRSGERRVGEGWRRRVGEEA